MIPIAATLSKHSINICMPHSFHYRKYKEFVETVMDLGQILTERKIHLVYGDVIEDYQSMSQKLLILDKMKCYAPKALKHLRLKMR